MSTILVTTTNKTRIELVEAILDDSSGLRMMGASVVAINSPNMAEGTRDDKNDLSLEVAMVDENILNTAKAMVVDGMMWMKWICRVVSVARKEMGNRLMAVDDITRGGMKTMSRNVMMTMIGANDLAVIGKLRFSTFNLITATRFFTNKT